jgi:hypothetical protein
MIFYMAVCMQKFLVSRTCFCKHVGKSVECKKRRCSKTKRKDESKEEVRVTYGAGWGVAVMWSEQKQSGALLLFWNYFDPGCRISRSTVKPNPSLCGSRSTTRRNQHKTSAAGAFMPLSSWSMCYWDLMWLTHVSNFPYHWYVGLDLSINWKCRKLSQHMKNIRIERKI